MLLLVALCKTIISPDKLIAVVTFCSSTENHYTTIRQRQLHLIPHDKFNVPWHHFQGKLVQQLSLLKRLSNGVVYFSKVSKKHNDLFFFFLQTLVQSCKSHVRLLLMILYTSSVISIQEIAVSSHERKEGIDMPFSPFCRQVLKCSFEDQSCMVLQIDI